MAFKFPSWSGFNFTPTLHNTIPDALKPENQSLPEGLVVCITGASHGIGADIAKTFAQTGAVGLILTARTTAALQETADGCSALARNQHLKITSLAVTVDHEADVQALASHIQLEFSGKLDVLINNAGVVSTHPSAFSRLEDMHLSQVQDIMNVNYVGRFLTIKYLLPMLKKSEMKMVIDISSIGAHFTGGGPVAYNISALAANRLIEVVADTYQNEGVVAYSVHPGMVGNDHPPPGMDEDVNEKCGDSKELCGAWLTWLVGRRPVWLSGRYLSVNWDVGELEGMRGVFEGEGGGDLGRMRMVV